MQQPGRKTPEAVVLARFRGEPARLKPSPGLTEAYVRALLLTESTTKAIAAAPDDASPALIKANTQAYRMVHGLSMRLRVSPQARAGHINPASKLPRAARSYYDRDALDDEWGNPP